MKRIQNGTTFIFQLSDFQKNKHFLLSIIRSIYGAHLYLSPFDLPQTWFVSVLHHFPTLVLSLTLLLLFSCPFCSWRACRQILLTMRGNSPSRRSVCVSLCLWFRVFVSVKSMQVTFAYLLSSFIQLLIVQGIDKERVVSGYYALFCWGQVYLLVKLVFKLD